jgi:Mor family transcriptional regulator
MSKYTVDDLPEDALPRLSDLSGDLRMVANLVGVRMALKISELFDGTPARLYGHRRWLLGWRDKIIREEYDNGEISGVDLARKYGLSDRQIWNILGKVEGDDRQLRLF